MGNKTTSATRGRGMKGWISAGLAVSLLIAAAPAFSAEPYRLELDGGNSVGEIHMAVGKSQIIAAPRRLGQVIVGNPGVADIRMLSSQRVLLLGKAPGRTNLAFRDRRKDLVALMDVVVGYDIEGLKRKLHEVLPHEDNISVVGSNGDVILSGQVSSAANLDSALAVARSFAGKGVVNMLQVAGGQQVLLEARIAEVSRTAVKSLGVETTIKGHSGHNFAFGLITGDAAGAISAGQAFGSGLTLSDNTAVPDLQLRLTALENQGLARILAEPNIVALSGQEANFLAGGEFPVPVVQSGALSGSTTVEFKQFGVGLKFTPTVLSSDKISLRLNTEVSSIDKNTGTSVNGVTVPGVSTRRAGTTVEMADGQSFAIAGLLQSDIDNAIDKFPGLGDLPVLGTLFRSSNFQRKETELVILITPHLVKPVPGNRLKVPTDGFIPPSDRDQYLEGRLEGAPEASAQKPAGNGGAGKPESTTPSGGGVEGAYGHQL